MAYSLCSSHDNARQQRDDEQNNNIDDDDSSSNNGFLEHLHQLLDEHSIGSCGQRIVSWNSDGLSFQIHDPQKFQSLLMPLYFSNIDYKYRYPLLSGYDAFLKRLRNFGFHRIENEGIYKDTFSHPLFVRGKPKLALRMSGLVAKQHQQSLQLRRNSWPMPPLTLAKGLYGGRSKSTTSTRTSSFGTTATNTRPLFSGLSGLQLKLAKGMIPRKSGQSIDKPFVFRQALQRRKRPVVPEKNHSLGGNSSLGIVSLDSIGNSFGRDNNSSHQNQFQHGQQQQNNNNINNNNNNNNANEATASDNTGFLDIFLDLTEQDYQERPLQQQPLTAAIHVPQNLPQTQSQSHSHSHSQSQSQSQSQIQPQIQPQTHYQLDDSDDRARMAAYNALDDDELERELHPTIRTIDVEPLDLYVCPQEDGVLDEHIYDFLSTL